MKLIRLSDRLVVDYQMIMEQKLEGPFVNYWGPKQPGKRDDGWSSPGVCWAHENHSKPYVPMIHSTNQYTYDELPQPPPQITIGASTWPLSGTTAHWPQITRSVDPTRLPVYPHESEVYVRVSWATGPDIDSGPFYTVDGREAFMAAAIGRAGVAGCRVVWKDKAGNEVDSDKDD